MAQIKAGRYSYGHENILVFVNGNTNGCINIGNFTSIAAENVTMFLANGVGHEPSTGTTYPFAKYKDVFDKYRNWEVSTRGNINIGNDVWIGAGATFMSGVTVGDGAVIASSSHVVTDVPPYSYYGGNPAQLIKYRFTPEIIDKFLELKWWDLTDIEINQILPELQQEPTLETFDRIKELLKS